MHGPQDDTTSATLPPGEPDDELKELLGKPRRRRLRWVAIGVAIVVIVGWAVVVGRRFGTDPTQVRSPLINKDAPAFALPALEGGGEVRSADFAGEIYVVNFWASWCVPCREEAPVLEAFHQAWSDQGVNLVGIVYQDNRDDAIGFRREFGLTFPQARDPGGRTALDFGVFGIPETYVMDRRGVVKAKLVGAVRPGTLDQVVASVTQGETVTERNDRYRTGPDDN